MYQKIIITGRLGADPEMRYAPSGQAYTRFSVACDRKWTDANGEKQSETTWYRIIVWGKQAESCNQYLGKGRLVTVEGDRLKASAYLNREGTPAASLELTGQVVRFLDSKAEGGAPASGGEEQPIGGSPLEDEEMPF